MLFTRGLTSAQTLFRAHNGILLQKEFVLKGVQRNFAVTSHYQNINKYKSEEQREDEKKDAKQSKFKFIGLTVVGGAIAGGIWGYLGYSRKKKEEAIANDDTVKQYLLAEAPPKFKPAREIPVADGKSQNFKITLFQYQTCPFCCKARAFLDYFGLAYDVIEVNSVLRKEVKWSKYKKVPIVVVEFGDKVSFNILTLYK